MTELESMTDEQVAQIPVWTTYWHPANQDEPDGGMGRVAKVLVAVAWPVSELEQAYRAAVAALAVTDGVVGVYSYGARPGGQCLRELRWLRGGPD